METKVVDSVRDEYYLLVLTTEAGKRRPDIEWLRLVFESVEPEKA